MAASSPETTTSAAGSGTWNRNTEFFREHGSAASLHAILASRETAAGGWRLEVAPDRGGLPQYRPLGPAGAGAPLHSPRDPLGEARRQVERWLESNPLAPGRVVVVFGLAAGFHLQALAEHLDDTQGLLVLDLNPGVVADAMHHADFTRLADCRAKNIRLVVGEDSERMYGEFYEFIALWPRLDYSFFIHPGTQRAFAEIYAPMSRRLAEKVRVDMLQRCTMMSLTRNWLESAIRNLPFLIDSSPLAGLRNVLAGTPAAVVAAGPTLAASLDLLRELRERMVIIAVGTAYRPLRKAGIDPHLTVLVDGSPVIARQFDEVDTEAGWLVVPPQIHPEVVERFRGRLVSWQSGALPEFRDWLAGQMSAPPDMLGSGGTVTYSAIDAANYLGCPEIYVFGMDLAFQDDGQTHVDNSMYTGRRLDRECLIPVPGNLRPQVWTTRQFASYIELLTGLAANLAATPGRRLLNVNPDGALIPNMIHCLPGDIDPARFAPVPDLAARIAERCPGGLLARPGMRQLIADTQKDLDEIETRARKATALCRQLAAPGAQTDPRTPSRLRRLQKAEARLGETSPGGLLLSVAVRASSMDTLSFCAGIGSGAENGFALVHDKCARYYADLADMIQWLRDELAATARRIETV
ncbi:MAG: DUF115 domain-containing protein [Lentisphaeria bacterium]|jgi:hypothetical protein|nr:DUF115 domain-containing protein [Lentisphaeria bacterium]